MSQHELPRLPDAPNYFEKRWGDELIRQLGFFFQGRLHGDRDIEGKLATRGGRLRKITTVVSASYIIQLNDEVVDCNFGGAVALTLPLNPGFGQELIVQDSSGAAAGNNITTTPPVGFNLNGGTSGLVLATNYGRLKFIYNGTQYVGA